MSTPGTPVSRPRTGEGLEEQIKMNFSAVDNGAVLRVRPQGQSLLRTLGFDAQDEETQVPDFYMPDGQGKKLSESYQMYTTEKTPEDNPGVLVKLSNLEKKYGTSMYLMDRKSGHLYVAGIEGYKQIDEKGLLYPSESMIIAGALRRKYRWTHTFYAR